MHIKLTEYEQSLKPNISFNRLGRLRGVIDWLHDLYMPYSKENPYKFENDIIEFQLGDSIEGLKEYVELSKQPFECEESKLKSLSASGYYVDEDETNTHGYVKVLLSYADIYNCYSNLFLFIRLLKLDINSDFKLHKVYVKGNDNITHVTVAYIFDVGKGHALTVFDELVKLIDTFKNRGEINQRYGVVDRYITFDSE